MKVPPAGQETYPGLYRGVVVQNNDFPTEQGGKAKEPICDKHGPLGRLQVRVPQVYGNGLNDEDLPWAEPVVPFLGGGLKDGVAHGAVILPPIGSTVWIMFEHGDPQRPCWIGTWWGKPDGEYEIPQEAIDLNRPQQPLGQLIETELTGDRITEANRSGTSYPDIRVLKAPGGPKRKEEKLGMCIRFVGDKRIDIILDEDNYIEIDGHGYDAEGSPEQIRIHSSNYRVVVDSDLDDEDAVYLYSSSESGGIRIEAAPGGKVVQVSEEYGEPDPETGIKPLLYRGWTRVEKDEVYMQALDVEGKKSSSIKITPSKITIQSPNINGSGPVSGGFWHPTGGGHSSPG